MMEVGRVFEVAERGHSMRFGSHFGRPRRPKFHRTQRTDAETERVPTGN
jgi:hypothetical protein